MQDFNDNPHRRYNILTGEWVLVSPHRTKRPWQGKNEAPAEFSKISYDENCYLCPGNMRASGDQNPDYDKPFSFTNDFSALLKGIPEATYREGLLKADSETGICKVVCFSPNHSLTLPIMKVEEITEVVKLWKHEFSALGSMDAINYVQIFENKGAVMGCSNPHPHGQIWAQRSIPEEIKKKTKQQKEYWEEHKKSLLTSYLDQELALKERVLIENHHFVALVPYWAVWPFETIIIPRRKVQRIDQLTIEEEKSFAEIIKELTTKYDNIFKTSFPYSSGIHQAPTDGLDHEEWHMHMSFYPPLLRSSTVKKFMVGYEMFANPQRDITAEQAAKTIREQSDTHYSYN
ncbi:UDP-glucose--hexose-1-phosphate uridylyltransferase [Aquimarina sp. RZ0]|uniref:UDP-glucose--hexose-1-phosphate uridylyltransferase n=1 Tax=Aquimarina sp. RZ0 TaxID=2607730 RepID=UPI0011F1A69C|nr:UDP-glucose--hexose-1-phosphate uridylyltransferase [Aquimarina sp. RZ0]KAA1241551.1 UDP-glucose--hexose-1-phosphate uridylyltransferase [Aquimarina sp. RZ0]